MYQALWDIFVGNLCCYFILYFIAQGQNIYAWIDYVTTNKSVIYLWCFVISTLVQWDIYLWQFRISIHVCIFDSLGYLFLVLWDICLWQFGISTCIFGAMRYLQYLILWDIYLWWFGISVFGSMGYLSWVPYLLLLDIFSWSENQSTRTASVNGQSRRAGSFLRTVRDRVNWLSIRWGVPGAEIQVWKVKSDKQD